MSIIQEAVQAVVKKAIAVAPDAWMPGSKPDPLLAHRTGLIGAPISRLDGPLKVQGQARFAAEFPMEGMVYAALVYSTVPRGRIVTLDTRAAQAASGVVLVMTHENAPRMKPMPLFMSKDKAAGGDDLPVMQDDRVHWNGQPIALVLAQTQEQADHAKSLVRVAYDTEPATTSFAAAKAKGTKPGTFQGSRSNWRSATRKRRWLAPRTGSMPCTRRRGTTTTRSSCMQPRSRGTVTTS